MTAFRLTILFFLATLSQARAAGFAFSQDKQSGYYCTPEQQAAIVEQANGAVDILRYGSDQFSRLAGAGGPASDSLTQKYLVETQHWFGGMPSGDPAHPSVELEEWQSKLHYTSATAMYGAQALDPGEMFGICLPSTDPRCPAKIDGMSAKDTLAHFIDLDFGMMVLPTIAFCPAWFLLPPRGSADSRLSIYMNQAVVLAHEAMHKNSKPPVFDDLTALDLETAEAYAGKSTAGNNSANVQFALAGIDDRRKHEGDGGSDFLGFGPGAGSLTNPGCNVVGRKRADAVCLTVLALFWVRRRNRCREVV